MKLASTAFCLTALFCAAGAAATDQLDQSVPIPSPSGGSGLNHSFEYAQTFTVGRTGFLTRVVLGVEQFDGVTQNLLVDVRAVDQLKNPLEANSPVLAFASISPSAVPISGSVSPAVNVDLSAADLPVTAGEVLAIALRSNETNGYYDWFGGPQGQDIYAGGSGYMRNQYTNGLWSTHIGSAAQDYSFKTYVSSTPVPEPVSPAAILVLVGLLMRRKRVESGAAGLMHVRG
jgi:hypothetical protein